MRVCVKVCVRVCMCVCVCRSHLMCTSEHGPHVPAAAHHVHTRTHTRTHTHTHTHTHTQGTQDASHVKPSLTFDFSHILINVRSSLRVKVGRKDANICQLCAQFDTHHPRVSERTTRFPHVSHFHTVSFSAVSIFVKYCFITLNLHD